MTAGALREWRAARSLSQRQLAEALGVSTRTVEDWEQARRGGPPGRVLELALAALAAEAPTPDDLHGGLNEN